MMARRGVGIHGRGRPRQRSASSARDLRRVERLADDAGRGHEDLVGFEQPAACGRGSRRQLTASRPRLPVKALALPELTDERACHARARVWLRHHSTGADAVLRPGEHAGDRGAGVEQRTANRSVRPG